MGALTNLLARSTTMSTRSMSFGFGNPLLAGKTQANEKSSLSIAAFYNGIDQLSNDIAKLPKSVLQRKENARIPISHPYNKLIGLAPNEMMNAFDFWKLMEYKRKIKGNSICLLNKNSTTGFVESIIPLNNVQIIKHQGKLFYKHKQTVYHSGDVLHFKGFSLDGIEGVGIITFAAHQLGLALELQQYEAEVYQARGITYGVIETDKPVADPNKKLIADGFANKMSSGNVHQVAVLDEGFKYKSIAITPAEAKLLEAKPWIVQEICRWLNIAPHKIKDLSQGNNAHIYMQNIEHVQDSIVPAVTTYEQELRNKLFGFSNEDLTVKFNVNALLRGDLDSKQKYYTAMIYSGAYTRNEVRELEDMMPLEGLDEPLQPVNYELLSQFIKGDNKDGK